MRLNEFLLGKCEEFFELIVNEEQEDGLSSAIDSLREFLEKDVDGWTNHEDEALACIVRRRLMDIWGQIPKAEKRANADLRENYDSFIRALEFVMNPRSREETEYGEGLFDLEGREPHVTDSQSLMYWEE